MRLKHRLQRKYEQAHPRLRDIIPAIVDQEEKNAWELSLFPHLLFPGLIEERMTKLAYASIDESTQTQRKFAARCRSIQTNVNRGGIPRLQGLPPLLKLRRGRRPRSRLRTRLRRAKESRSVSAKEKPQMIPQLPEYRTV
jgi:hypothetical protein